jgi:hypothetical protein
MPYAISKVVVINQAGKVFKGNRMAGAVTFDKVGTVHNNKLA